MKNPRGALAIAFILIMIGAINAPMSYTLAESLVADPAPLPEQIELRFFHETACGSCDGASEFLEIINESIHDVRDLYPYTIYTQNVIQSQGRAAFEELTDEIGISRENLKFPLMVVGSKVYQGLESIRNNAREVYLTAGEDIFVNGYVYWPSRDKDKPLFDRYSAVSEHATLVYFYRATCDECNSIRAFMDSLPDSVMVNGQSVSVDVVRINTRSGNNNQRVYAFFDEYQVAENDQSAPIVFLTNGYLVGAEQIEAELIKRLEAGEGMGFSFPE
ncbi:hypothetical protein FACS1894184_08910 [Clostridia bacterium]|nr:hypothetical protein FACS1894184_08910 [Clostridia bacterium]